MKKSVRILLVVIAVVCFGIALYYPISEYVMQKQSVNTMDRLAALRNAGLEAAESLSTEAPAGEEATAEPAAQDETEQPNVQATAGQAGAEQKTAQPTQTAEAPASTMSVQGGAAAVPVTEAPATDEQTDAQETAQDQEPSVTDEVAVITEAPKTEPAQQDKPDSPAQTAQEPGAEQTPSPTPAVTPTPSPTPTATPDRHVTTGAKIWADMEKIPLDESKILPQYQELYSINSDMVGWLTVSATKIDYPVMQTEDEEYYLTHDFFHENNANGLLILDSHCDPYTPSYNLVVSGHNRKNDTIFSNLYEYFRDKRHRDAHMFIQFDSLMEERTYVVFAAFFSADYDVDEEGFRYNANIEYAIDAKQWLRDINEYKLYETNVDVGFGDQFLTLTTCNSSRRKNGRFVVVARRVREGETFE